MDGERRLDKDSNSRRPCRQAGIDPIFSTLRKRVASSATTLPSLRTIARHCTRHLAEERRHDGFLQRLSE